MNSDATRHVSARLPEVLAAQIDLVRTRQGMRHNSDALAFVIDHGLDAIARLDRRPDRIEGLVARTEDLAVTILAILNLAHRPDPDAVAETRAAVLSALAARAPRGKRPDAKALGFAPEADA